MSNSDTKYPPFSCSYSPNVSNLLNQLKCSIVISTYQAGKVVFISPDKNEKLVQLPRSLKKAMGIAFKEDKMAIACLDEVIQFSNSKQLAAFYPKKKNVYDALFMPRITYHTGFLDIHDLEFGNDGLLYAVNTYFSCLIKIDSNYNFTPIWKPSFISKLASEDRCHLNGMAMENGYPKYATAFNQGDTPKSWKKDMTDSGVLIDIADNTILADNLKMPHSPRIHQNKLYVLQSATGELVEINLENSTKNVIVQIDGFVRGLDFIDNYAFIGLSKIRKGKDNIFTKLAIADKASYAGIAIIDIKNKVQVGLIKYHASVEEIYDVQLLPNILRPNLLNTITEQYKSGLMIPSTTFWGSKPEDL